MDSKIVTPHPLPSRALPPTGAIIRGAGNYPFSVMVDGPHLVVRHEPGNPRQRVRATHFGGPNDPQDEGGTWSGLSTIEHPEILGVALPMAILVHGRPFSATRGTPIPALPKFNPVKVWCPETDKIVRGVVVDVGPSNTTGNAIDCMESVWRALGLAPERGGAFVHFRIFEAAKYLQG